LRARLNVRKVRGSLVVEPYSDVVTQKEEGVKEYLELLNRLMGGSSSVEAAEIKGKEGKRSVAFQELIMLKATFFQEKVAGT
jgi:hypothetical protein